MASRCRWRAEERRRGWETAAMPPVIALLLACLLFPRPLATASTSNCTAASSRARASPCAWWTWRAGERLYARDIDAPMAPAAT
jgi:hypothetical protein